MDTIIIDTHSLRSAGEGEAFAEQLSDLLRQDRCVSVDMSAVEMMTPSYANTLLMILLERFTLETLRERCKFLNRSEHVVRAMNRAVLRYQSGIRLSTQRPVVA